MVFENEAQERAYYKAGEIMKKYPKVMRELADIRMVQMRNGKWLHPNPIPTTRKVMVFELQDKGRRAMMSLFQCFTCDRGSEEYKRRVFVTAMYLERISCPVYPGTDGEYRCGSYEV